MLAERTNSRFLLFPLSYPGPTGLEQIQNFRPRFGPAFLVTSSTQGKPWVSHNGGPFLVNIDVHCWLALDLDDSRAYDAWLVSMRDASLLAAMTFCASISDSRGSGDAIFFSCGIFRKSFIERWPAEGSLEGPFSETKVLAFLVRGCLRSTDSRFLFLSVEGVESASTGFADRKTIWPGILVKRARIDCEGTTCERYRAHRRGGSLRESLAAPKISDCDSWESTLLQGKDKVAQTGQWSEPMMFAFISAPVKCLIRLSEAST